MSGYKIIKWSVLTKHLDASVTVPLFHPEYGRFMLESTPGAPFSNKVSDLLTVEDNMRYRLVRFRNISLEITEWVHTGVRWLESTSNQTRFY